MIIRKYKKINNSSEIDIVKKYKRIIVRNLVTRITLLLIFLLIVIITGFKSGEKFFLLKNTNFNDTSVSGRSIVAKWHFDAKLKY